MDLNNHFAYFKCNLCNSIWSIQMNPNQISGLVNQTQNRTMKPSADGKWELDLKATVLYAILEDKNSQKISMHNCPDGNVGTSAIIGIKYIPPKPPEPIYSDTIPETDP